MAVNTKKKEYTLDASGKKLGRLATDVAVLLIGKNEPNFRPNAIPNVEVTIINVEKLSVDERKADSKVYVRYSGYPGGLKEETLAELRDKKGMAEVLRRAVWGMIPTNKLRKERMKRLIIS